MCAGVEEGFVGYVEYSASVLVGASRAEFRIGVRSSSEFFCKL